MSVANPVDLWKRSSTDVKATFTGPNVSATPLFLSSPVITSFSGDKLYLQKIFEQWPIKLERRAVFWPPHATFIACGTAGIIIGIRVNSHTFLGDANFSHGDLCNTCLLLGSIATALAGGVCLPMFSSPYLTAASVSFLINSTFIKIACFATLEKWSYGTTMFFWCGRSRVRPRQGVSELF
ncbi:unnamed protein product [Gongylonema pulchrum]|uniref:Ammonium_transp domain-containing protein n=1 Tax=Gongylonema pulchrum TaxID=637853 RepID=A0A183E1E9_9BILA|nr:unnamed protein product [Gongylonema pulchrum]